MQQLLHRVVAILALAMTCSGMWAADYVFMSDSNYIIINNSGAITTTTTFSPSCLWSGTSGGAFTNNGFTLKYSQNSPSGSGTFYYTTTLNSTGTDVPLVVSADGTIQFTANVSATYYNYYIISGWNPTSGTWYIQLNGSNVVASTTSSSEDNIKAYLVTTTDYPALTYIEGIEGNDAIGLTGTYNYSRIGSAIATTPACTKYTFNSTNYYKLSDNTITTTNPNPVSEEFTYTWSATCNDATYTGFSINATTGALTVTSLPTVDKTVTITLQATKTGYETQTVTKSVNVSNRPPTGVTGGTIYLNDYEDHTWTYYAGVPSDVDGGNYNDNYVGKMYSPDPRNVKITYKANGGAVSIDESETEFVYYKTLEESSTAGEYQYQVISNPFSKRPAGKGFGGWQITKGANYIKGKNANATLALDEEIVFNNLGNPDVNATAAEIEFTATWVDAKVQTITSNPSNNREYTFTGGTYETNFIVLKNVNYTRTMTISSPCTIMMVEPDGSADYRNSYTFTGNITPNNNGVTKIEFAKWDPNGNITMAGRNLWIGRGVTCTGDTRSVTLAGNSVSNQIVKIESGKFSTLTHYSAGPSTNSTTPLQRLTLGNDYDRAKKDWETSTPTLEFTDRLILAEPGWLSSCNVVTNSVEGSNTYMTKVLSKSGKFMTGVSVSAAAYSNSYYLSVYGGGRTGKRYLELEGGEWVNIAGGRDDDRNGTKNTKDYIAFTFRMRGGHVKGSIYGGAEQYSVQGSRQIVITGGEVNGWVAGGANGTTEADGATTGMSYVYVGGNARVDSKGSATSIGASLGGNIYAAGCGYNTSSSSGEVTLGTNVVFGDNAYVERGVYGGGAFGFCSNNQKANVYITGGTVNGASGTYQTRGNSPTTTPNIIGGVFGGARQNKGGYANIYMTGGLVKSGVFGGSNNSGTLSNDVKMVITGGQVGTTSQTANIHGGGYGASTVVSGNVDITLGKLGQKGATLYGNVYGGSALGQVNTNADNHTWVTMNAGSIHGNLFGGGMGELNGTGRNATPVDGEGVVNGAIKVVVNDTDPTILSGANNEVKTYAVDGVFGGCDLVAYAGTPIVEIHNCESSIGYVYGGGNASDVQHTDVTIYGGDINYMFGGGNGEDTTKPGANIVGTSATDKGNTNVKIYGGTINHIFGGSNTLGDVTGTATVYLNEEEGDCPILTQEAYGGANKAPMSGKPSLNIGCLSGRLENVYGGSKAVDINSDIVLNITSGQFGKVFGGNNESGAVNGSITVNIDETGCHPIIIDELYAGGNLAPYTTPSGKAEPTVNVISCSHIGQVFGGGYGETAIITGNPIVNINQIPGKYDPDDQDGSDGYSTNADNKLGTIGMVFGGGNAAKVAGDTHVNIGTLTTNKHLTTEATDTKCGANISGNVYGGGNAADVTGKTNVQVGPPTTK